MCIAQSETSTLDNNHINSYIPGPKFMRLIERSQIAEYTEV